MENLEIHPSVTIDRVMEACDDSMSNPGFCICCGEDAFGVEPDAREYECEACESNSVYSAEELLFMVD